MQKTPAPNDAPKLVPIPDRVAVVGEPLEFVIQAKDTNQDNLTFTTIGLPAGATITPTGIYGRSILSWTPTAADIGNYPITLKVTDSGNSQASAVLSNEQVFNLVVRASNISPLLSIVGNKSIAEESTLTFQLTGSDVDGDTLTYTSGNLPTGAILNAQTGVFSWQPTAGQAGIYRIEFTTTDGNKRSSETIDLTVNRTNHNPILTQLPLQRGLENDILKFSLAGSDVDKDTLVYTILGVSKDTIALPIPSGTYLDQNTGRFAWTPNYNQSGEYTFKFAVIDPDGSQDTKDVKVLIDNVNRQPTLSISNHATTLGNELKFNVAGNDLDLNTQLIYTAEDLPPGATLNADTGEYSWNPNPGQLGDYTVKFTVSDGTLTAFKAVVISAKTSIAAPKITVDLTPSFPVIVGQKVVVNTLADSIANIDTIQVKVDGSSIDTFKYNSARNGGSFNFSSTQTGRHSLEITTTDVDGRSSKIDRVIKVKDTRDTLAPIVEFATGLNGAKLTSDTQIFGKVADTNLDEWQLEIGELGTDNYRVITSGTNTIDNLANLISLNPQTLVNGFYELKLTGTDISGRKSVSTAIVEVNTPTKSGYQNTTTDLSLTLAGIPVNITRRYDANTGKWTFNTDSNIQLNLSPLPLPLSPLPPLEINTRLYLTTPTGERVGFTFTPVRQQISGAVYYTPAWIADAGVNYTLESVDVKLTLAGSKFYELGSGIAYNPANGSSNGAEYTLTAIDGTEYLLDAKQGLVGQIAPNGTKLIYSDSGIIASTGDSVEFVKDKAGNVTQITAPDGTQLGYEYDTQGQLVSLRNNSTGKVQSFGYAAGQLQAIVGDTNVVINPTGSTRPIQANLSSIANLNGSSITTTAAPTQTYSFNLRESELNSIASHSLLISIEGENTSQINGIAPVYTKGNYQIFAVDKAGINLLDISNPLLQATTYNLRVVGDLNNDGKVDGIDSQLLTKAFTTPFDVRSDLNRDGIINDLDLQLLGGNYGFIAAPKASSTNRPTKLGTVRKTPSGITLVEGNGLLTQMTTAIAIDNTPGQKQLVSFDLNTYFDLSDKTSIIEDQFAVYLVDSTTHQTILDRGERGTSLFSLTGKTAEFAKGLVTYDGQKVSIDLGSLTNINNAELVFQLINNDTDTTGVIDIQNLTDTLTNTPVGTLIGALPTRVTPGAAIANLDSYTATTAPKLQLTNVRLDSNTGKYTADLRIENTGTAPLPRQLAVLFPNLPTGVRLATKSGVTVAGTPYINLHNTMVVGGLAPRETNTVISVEFDDINLVRLDLQPTFLAGAQDVAPTLQALGTINLTPGQVFSIPLIATDPNGAPITISIDTKGNLPTGTLTEDNTLVFNPSPTQLGTYTFTLIAKQGLLTTSETVTLNVIPDTVTTTRLSGKVNRDKLTALGGAVVDIDGVQTTTNADGSFLITLPTNTATTIKINGVTQQLSQLLGHQLYSGVNNQVGATIYIPTVDTNGSQTSGNTVTNSNLPKVTLLLPNSPTLPLPTIQLGSIDSSLIPADLFTTGTPKSLVAVTITGTLTIPAKLTLANDFAVDPGTNMDLWRIDPNSGLPTIVGAGKVNGDGTLIDTVSGGVMGAGWYYYVPTPVAQQSPEDNAYNLSPTLDVASVTIPINSEANLFTGEVRENYQLQGYQSLGANQSLQLSYSSKRANSEFAINFEYKAFAGSQNNGLFAKLTLRTGYFMAATATRQWQLAAPPTNVPVQAALKIDTSTLASGIYTYDLTTGLNNIGDSNAQTLNRTRAELIHVSNIVTPFGTGWGLAGLQQIVINNQNSISNESLLLIDGNGTEQKFTVINRAAGVTEYRSFFGDLSTFKRAADGTYERKLIDETTYKFYATGFLHTVTDRHGNITEYSYDGDNIISSIKDAANLITTFHRNGNRIEEIKDPAGRVTKLSYDGNGDLTSVEDPDTTVSKWEYNSKHLMTKSIDKLNKSGTDVYDDFGRVTSAVRKDGSKVEFNSTFLSSIPSSYILKASNTGVTTVSTDLIPLKPGGSTPTIESFDANGNKTTIEFNKFGQAVKIIDDIGIKKNEYNSRGTLIQSIDEKGNKTSYNYNERNQVVEIAYGDKLSSPSFLALYGNSSDKYSTIANINHIGYVKNSLSTTVSGVTTTITNQYVVTSDNRGQIVTKEIANDGKLSTMVIQSLSLRNILEVKPTGRLTVKKLLVGDFDGDTKLDIAVGYSRETFNDNLTNYLSPFTEFTGGRTTYTDSQVYTNVAGIIILKGDGAGKFSYKSNQTINPMSNRFDVYQFEIADLVAGDFDDNGTLDIAATNRTDPIAADWTGVNNYQLYILGNDGTGKLSSVKGNNLTNRAIRVNNYSAGSTKALLATSKGSGGKDLLAVAATPDQENSIVTTYSGDSDGRLTKVYDYNIPGLIYGMKTADLNGDGVDEIIVNAGQIYIINPLVSNISTNPQASKYTTQNTGFWSFMDVSDVNKDGAQDVIVANDNSTLKVFLGNKITKLFDTAPQIYQGTSSPRGLIVKDINNDLLPDVIIGDAYAGFDVKLQINDSVATSASVVNQLFEYDPKFGQLTKSTDELGRKTIYDIDSSNGDIRSITKKGDVNTPNSVTNFDYIGNSWGLASKITDAEGKVIENTYDPRGRLIQVKQGDVMVSAMTYDDLSGNLLTKTDGSGKVTQYSYKANTNRIETETYDASLGVNQKTNYNYDAKGQLISVINSDGYGQKFEDYDGLGRARTVKQLTAKGEIVQRYEYYNTGDIHKVINSDNQTIEYLYDARNRVREIHNIDGSTTKYSYDALNNLTQVIDAEGYETNYKYESTTSDSRMRQTEIGKQVTKNSYLDALVTKTDYNNALQVTEVIDDNGKKTKYKYDGLGRQTQVTQELDIALDSGATEIVNKTTYYNNGNIKTITDGNNRTTTYTYNARNLKLTSTDALGTITTYTYDDAGNVTGISTVNPNIPGAASITYGYDALNRRTKVIDALMGETNTTYDLSGNITRIEDANHQKTEYQYQPANRTTTTTDALEHKIVATYDALGRIATLTQKKAVNSTEEDRVTAYTYDLINNTTTVTRPEGVVETTKRDSVGNVKSVTTTVNGENRTTAYKHNGSRQVTLITDAQNNQKAFEYNKLVLSGLNRVTI